MERLSVGTVEAQQRWTLCEEGINYIAAQYGSSGHIASGIGQQQCLQLHCCINVAEVSDCGPEGLRFVPNLHLSRKIQYILGVTTIAFHDTHLIGPIRTKKKKKIFAFPTVLNTIFNFKLVFTYLNPTIRLTYSFGVASWAR